MTTEVVTVTTTKTTKTNTNSSSGADWVANGLSASDDEPLVYFYRYAGNYFDTLADLDDALNSGARKIDCSYLAYCVMAWHEMARGQWRKYQQLISSEPEGRATLLRLGFLEEGEGFSADGDSQEAQNAQRSSRKRARAGHTT